MAVFAPLFFAPKKSEHNGNGFYATEKNTHMEWPIRVGCSNLCSSMNAPTSSAMAV